MTQQHTWNPKLAAQWDYVKPPGHPSSSELRIYERFIRNTAKKQSPAVLILGSTPELRDLCHKHCIAPSCVDYHKENFHILSSLKDLSGEENLINADWREMDLTDQYDLVLGDIALQMVPHDDNPRILVRLRKALHDHGTIVHRNWIRIPGAYRDFAEVVADHRKRKHKLHPFSSLIMPVLQHCFDDEKGLFYLAQGVVPKVKDGYEQGHFTREEYEAIEQAWGEYTMPNYLPTKEQFEEMVIKFFSIEGVKYGTNWFRRFAPMYVLKK